jgi:hypothetical protein
MPLTLPNLDDRTWSDLVEEGQALIPGLAPQWTDFNPSDPGTTLVELFAYLTETLLYRIDRVSEPNRCSFLKLIQGPGPRMEGDLDDEIRRAMADLRHCHRAVTARDFETLAISVNEMEESKEKVVRAHCLPRRNLESAPVSVEIPGHVSVLIVPSTGQRPSDGLLRRVRSVLEPARLITTRVHVVAARYVTFGVRITLAVEKDAVLKTVQANAIAALQKFFDPMEGGPDGLGWPFGRDVFVSEVYQILSRLERVQYVTRTQDLASQGSLDELVVAPGDQSRVIRNRSGEMEAVDLYPDELPSARLAAADIDVTYVNS